MHGFCLDATLLHGTIWRAAASAEAQAAATEQLSGAQKGTASGEQTLDSATDSVPPALCCALRACCSSLCKQRRARWLRRKRPLRTDVQRHVCAHAARRRVSRIHMPCASVERVRAMRICRNPSLLPFLADEAEADNDATGGGAKATGGRRAKKACTTPKSPSLDGDAADEADGSAGDGSAGRGLALSPRGGKAASTRGAAKRAQSVRACSSAAVWHICVCHACVSSVHCEAFLLHRCLWRCGLVSFNPRVWCGVRAHASKGGVCFSCRGPRHHSRPWCAA